MKMDIACSQRIKYISLPLPPKRLLPLEAPGMTARCLFQLRLRDGCERHVVQLSKSQFDAVLAGLSARRRIQTPR